MVSEEEDFEEDAARMGQLSGVIINAGLGAGGGGGGAKLTAGMGAGGAGAGAGVEAPVVGPGR